VNASLSGLDDVFAAERRARNVHTAFVTLPVEPGAALASLTPVERRVVADFRFEKRRRDWLAGRLAAKAASLALLRSEGGPVLAAEDIEVRTAPTGRPEVLIHGAPSDGLRTTISHSGGAAGAAAYRERDAGVVGLDLERIADVDTALFPIAFTDAEVAWIHGAAAPAERRERVLRLWTSKEAVLKALGVGLSEALLSVEVAPGPPGEPWPAIAWRPAPAQRLLVRTARAGDWIVALAVSPRLERPTAPPRPLPAGATTRAE
jgi:phosphopantetheinyl transferase